MLNARVGCTSVQWSISAVNAWAGGQPRVAQSLCIPSSCEFFSILIALPGVFLTFAVCQVLFFFGFGVL